VTLPPCTDEAMQLVFNIISVLSFPTTCKVASL
jgi:hypothetical protein